MKDKLSEWAKRCREHIERWSVALIAVAATVGAIAEAVSAIQGFMR